MANTLLYSEILCDSFFISIEGIDISPGDDFDKISSILGFVDYELYPGPPIYLKKYDYIGLTVYTDYPEWYLLPEFQDQYPDDYVFSEAQTDILIHSLIITSNKYNYCGLTVGDQYEEVTRVLGEAHYHHHKSNTFYYFVTGEENGPFLIITFKNNVIETIGLSRGGLD